MPKSRQPPDAEESSWSASEPLPSPENLLDRMLVSGSPAMRRLKTILPRVAASRSSVLIQGESGTGKELIARAIHLLSPRAAAAFVAENCAALPEGVIESELFGHVRGAFTGAERDREGLLALANGGTFFLDEVGDLPRRIQAKLLRVIQDGEFRPVGGRRVKRSDFRIVAATHRDLAAMVGRGEFREDLYYRLNVIRLHAPPLRDRIEDIPPLVDHILRRLAGERAGRSVSTPGGALRESVAPLGVTSRERESGGSDEPSAGVSREALEMLLRYDWPGNVRELENVVEAGLVLAAEGVIGVAELPERIIDHALAEPAGAMESYTGDGKPRERVMIELALNRFNGDKAKAARYIGWSPSVAEKTSETSPGGASFCCRGWTTSVAEKIPLRVWIERFCAGESGWRAAA
jgi:transcriptional regulator with PAS, ATPase and Fis domain